MFTEKAFFIQVLQIQEVDNMGYRIFWSLAHIVTHIQNVLYSFQNIQGVSLIGQEDERNG